MSARAKGPFGAAVAVFYIFLWAAAYVPSKIAAIESPPLWFLVARFIAAGLLLALIARLMGKRLPHGPGAWVVASILGVLANALTLGLTYSAMQHHLSAGMGAIVASTNPLVLGLLAPQLLGERLSPLKSAGLALGFGGVIAIVLSRAGTGTALPQDVLLAFAGVCSSVASTVLFKRLGTRHDLIVLSAIALCAAGLALVPFAALVAGPPHVTLTPALIASFLFLVLALSVGATLIWFWLLTHGEASRVSAYYYLTPAFGLALSALLLGEHVGWRDLAGLAAIAGGIILTQRA
jgi:drug/metabolite transporter (DMT)-like permease